MRNEFIFVTARISAPSHSRRPGARRIAQFERGVAEIAIQRAVKIDFKARFAAEIDHAILFGSGSAAPAGLLSSMRPGMIAFSTPPAPRSRFEELYVQGGRWKGWAPTVEDDLPEDAGWKAARDGER